MASKASVIFNAAAQFLGKIGTIIASLVVVKIVTGVGTEFYGNYVTSYEFLAFFGILADAGLFAIAVKEIARKDSSKAPSSSILLPKGEGSNSKSNHPRLDPGFYKSEEVSFILGNVLGMRLVLILLFGGVACAVAQLIPSYPTEVKLGIIITAISMGLTIVAGTLSSVLQARMKIQFFSASLVLGKIILAGLILLLSTFFIQNVSPQNLFFLFLWAGVISNLVFASLVFYFAQKETSIRPQFNFNYWKQTLKVSIPYGLALILQTLYLRLDIILISVLLGSAAAGIYGVSGRVMESFLVLGVFFGQAFLPKIAQETDRTEAGKVLAWAAEKLVLVSLPIIWGTFLFADEIVKILSNENFLSTSDFLGSDTLLMILVPTVFFAFFNQLFTFTLVNQKKQIYLLLVNAVALILNGVLNVWLIPKYGLLAAAGTTVLCEVVVFTLLFSTIVKHFRIRFSALLWIILLNIILFGCIYFTALKNSLVLSALFGALGYGGFCYYHRKAILGKE